MVLGDPIEVTQELLALIENTILKNYNDILQKMFEELKQELLTINK